MSFVKPPVESWEMMRTIKGAVGMTGMQKIFSVGLTQINRYCRNPEFTSDTERNPLDRVRRMLAEASEAGAVDAAKAAADYIAEPLGMRLVETLNAEPDQPTTHEEMLSDWQSVALVQQLMRADEHPSVIRSNLDKAIEDMEQTFTSYKRDWEEKK